MTFFYRQLQLKQLPAQHNTTVDVVAKLPARPRQFILLQNFQTGSEA